MSNRLALYIKRDTSNPNAEWGVLATESFDLSNDPVKQHVNKLKAQRTLELIRSHWIHNGTPDYLQSAYKIEEYSRI